MKRWVVTICTVTLASSSFAWAESRDELLLRKSTEAAGRAFAESAVRGYLDKWSAQSAASTSAQAPGVAQSSTKSSGVGLGSKVVFAVSLGLAIDEFGKAKTDKGKGVATANAVAAGVALANPAAGLVLTAAILVFSLVDAHLSAGHAKVMMEIYTRIAQQMERMMKLRRQIISAEQEKFIGAFKMMDDADAKIEAGGNYLKENCIEARAVDDLGKVDSCLKSLVQLVSQYQRWVNLADEILKTENIYLQVDEMLKANKMSRVDIEKLVESHRYALAVMHSQLDESLTVYGRWTAEIIMERARTTSSVTQARLYLDMCVSGVRSLTLEGMNLVNQVSSNVDVQAYLSEVDEFHANACNEVIASDAKLEDMYLKTDVILNRLLKRLSNNVGVRL